jgi:tetratricopeptide (TPR) repeat protein
MRHFQGREEDLRNLAEVLEKRDQKVVWITGPSGVGKTSLAHELLRTAEDSRFGRPFKAVANPASYMADWNQVVIDTARQVKVQLSQRLVLRELEEKILLTACKEETLLLLDNVDSVAEAKDERQMLIGFVESWIASTHRSVMILTSRQIPREFRTAPGGLLSYRLKGLTQRHAIEALLGDDLVKLIGKDKVLKIAGALGGVPQKLIYLRWRDPKTKASLRTTIKELKTDVSGGGAAAVEAALHRIPPSLTHFLALGRVRKTTFEEPLLAFLWDRLGGGSTEVYVKVLQSLLQEKLLSAEEVSGKRVLRLSAGVHLGLEGPLLRGVRRERVGFIDHFVSEYYRNQFAEAGLSRLAIDLLEQYVYHALRCRSFESAYAYVFEGGILEDAHNQGRSLELEQVLTHFERFLDRLGTDSRSRKDLAEQLADPENARLAEQAARIRIEMGRVYNDLSRHPACLECMKLATSHLETPAGRVVTPAVRDELLVKVWYFSAISSSDLGRTSDCIENYSMVVASALKKDHLTSFHAMAMGYLAHELKYHDMEASLQWGRLALDWSRAMRASVTTIKNLCSLGQTLLFCGRIEEAEKTLEEAHAECRNLGDKGDLRELGRVLIHSAPVYIANRKWDVAAKQLKEGLDLNLRFGDRRRAATAIAYQGIMEFRQGKGEKGKDTLLQAVGLHLEIEDWRNLAAEVLTYMWMADSKFDGDLSMAFPDPLPTEIREAHAHISADSALQVFVGFWREHFKPVLLEA